MKETKFKQTELGVIPKNWEVWALGETSDIKTGPFGSSLHASDYVSNGTPIITVEHIGNPYVKRNMDIPMVSEKDKDRLSAYSLKHGDLIFSRVGSVDRNCMITDKENGWLFSGRILRVRPNPDVINSMYLSYHLAMEKTRKRIITVAVGLAMPSINTRIYRSLRL